MSIRCCDDMCYSVSMHERFFVLCCRWYCPKIRLFKPQFYKKKAFQVFFPWYSHVFLPATNGQLKTGTIMGTEYHIWNARHQPSRNQESLNELSKFKHLLFGFLLTLRSSISVDVPSRASVSSSPCPSSAFFLLDILIHWMSFARNLLIVSSGM